MQNVVERIIYPPLLALPDLSGNIVLSFEADGTWWAREGMTLEQALDAAAEVLAIVHQPGYERDEHGAR